MEPSEQWAFVFGITGCRTNGLWSTRTYLGLLGFWNDGQLKQKAVSLYLSLIMNIHRVLSLSSL